MAGFAYEPLPERHKPVDWSDEDFPCGRIFNQSGPELFEWRVFTDQTLKDPHKTSTYDVSFEMPLAMDGAELRAMADLFDLISDDPLRPHVVGLS